MTDPVVTVTKPGRPLKGERPMTGTERKRAQRVRDKRNAIDAIGHEQDAPLRALLNILERVEVSEPARHSARRAWLAFGQRYGFVTVTKK
ncbi:conserved hypothetical protein [Candidatus Accumulibacter aalborgensis]|uniref:Uncharacterized protein n=1 Tax=Candidatus Accumulibacter aalborgensis TaxID=1860102 RepID=A0A1A8XXK8_9PROT|nr:hypothetical protein [Candidatus Accumulibacter aalborgensis]SBT09451.1 conserved hypothetical protein [Candidatus Accumulibacter aalborgensis]